MSTEQLTFGPDELDGFEQATIELASEGDGPLCATLVRPVGASPVAPHQAGEMAPRAGEESTRAEGHRARSPRPAVLYLHGFADYFFQDHLAAAVEASGFAFYALDLRRHGRSLRPGNRANQARDIADYFEEIDQALSYLLAQHGKVGGFIQHSTGALIGAHYLERGKFRDAVPCAVFNSPFFRFHLRPRERVLSLLVAGVGRVLPTLRIPQRQPATYSLSIHQSGAGAWNYSLQRKPLAGFPLHAGWFTMIRRAQAQLRRGLDLPHPLLVLHSSSSHFSSSEQPRAEDLRADIVVNVEDIRQIAPRLGRRVRLQAIPHGMHDLYLSAEVPRMAAFDATLSFLKKHGLDE